MGSAITTVGNRGGKPLFTFTTASQDSGVILSTAPVLVGGVPITGDLPVGYKNLIFQLTGSNTAGGVLIYGTIDLQTALGNGTEWTPIPSPSTEAANQWANPVTKTISGQAACKADAPWIAYRAVSSSDFAGSAVLQVLASP